MDPYQIERKDPDPHQSDELDPDPHQSDKLDQDPQLFADYKPKSRCMAYEPIWASFKVLSLSLEARIRIRIKVKGTVP
jgi:hypothetical protein